MTDRKIAEHGERALLAEAMMWDATSCRKAWRSSSAKTC